MEATNKQKSSGLKIVLTLFLLFAFISCGTLAFFGARVIKDPELLKNLTNGLNLKQTNTATQKTATNFYSDTIVQPSGNTVELVKKIAPSVTTVVVKVPTQSPFTNQESVEEGVGTGFFVSEEGLLITNEHVVCNTKTPANISVVTSDDKTYTVESFTTDPFQDIAVLKVNTKGEKIAPLKFANPQSALMPGMDVIAIGNPLGVNPGSVTKGIISGLGRNVTAQGSCQNQNVEKDYEGVIQTDAAINSGNSGGPLINTNGEVVGVNSATSSDANNISYAVPYDRVVKLLERYEANNGKITLPFLGVSYQMIDANVASAQGIPQGAYVRQVAAGTPAEQSGIKRGDIITKLGDHALNFSLQATLNQYFEPGQKIKVEIFRPDTSSLFGDDISVQGKTLVVDLTVGEKATV